MLVEGDKRWREKERQEEEEEDYLLHSLSLSPSHLAAEVRLAP